MKAMLFHGVMKAMLFHGVMKAMLFHGVMKTKLFHGVDQGVPCSMTGSLDVKLIVKFSRLGKVNCASRTSDRHRRLRYAS